MLYLDQVTSPSASLRDPHMLAEAGWGGGKGLAGGFAAAGWWRNFTPHSNHCCAGQLCGSAVRSAYKKLDLYSTCKGTLQMFK